MECFLQVLNPGVLKQYLTSNNIEIQMSTRIFVASWVSQDKLLQESKLMPFVYTFPHHLVSLQCKSLELKLEEERVFTEYEQVPKKRPDGLVTTAALPENTERNRFRDVVPYEENRVELVPNKENNTGYINASHIKVGEKNAISSLLD